VFFPQDLHSFPKLPPGMKSLGRPEGVYYYNPRYLDGDKINEYCEKGMAWAMLGFAQNKCEALKSKTPITVTVRNLNGIEIKSALVDSENETLIKMQAYIFGQWFPYMPISMDNVFNVIAERLVAGGVING
jgi:hypothetical protein